MRKYYISVQFAKASATFDDDAKAAITKGIRFYNTRSLMARNPKKIAAFRFLEDDMTLALELESEAGLPMPTKALRLLSSYLVEETCLSERLSGRQLFKMTSGAPPEVERPSSKQLDDTTCKVMDIETFRELSSEEKLVTIYELLCEINQVIKDY